MNGKQITILITAFVVSALILWHDLPLEFPLIIVKALKLFLKLFAVFAIAAFAYVFATDKKNSNKE